MRWTGVRWFWMGMLAVVTAAMLAATTAGADRFVRVKVDTANIREGPGTGYALLWQVAENFPLRVISQGKKWLKTEDFLGADGWIYAPLTDTQPAVVVEADVANVRSGPGTNHPVRFTAEWGASFRLLGRKGKWAQVEHADGSRGWIHEKLLWGSLN
ncbi:MAG: SH3 domain-containing protein [Candidatus Rokubacteria bacterium]|nr:SH3 domain-containing protein [Candidatus Rokubacteria bacterium]